MVFDAAIYEQIAALFRTRRYAGPMPEANRQQARFALILGGDELANNTIAVKEMESGEQKVLSLPDAIALLTA